MGVSCRKIYIIIAGFICLALGIALFLMAIIASERQKSDQDDSPVYRFNNTLLYVILGAGAFLFLMGIMGIMGVKRKSLKCVKCFQIFNCLCLLFFTLILVALGVLHFMIIEDLSVVEDCKQNFLIEKLDKWNQVGVEVLGSSDCPVRISAISDIKFYNDRKITHFSLNGAYSVYDCPEFEIQARQQFTGNYSAIMKSLERSHSCGGMCTYNNFYVFSDITMGTPQSETSCAEQIYEKMNGKSLIYFIVCAIVVSFLLINVLVAWNIQRKKNSETYLDDSDFGGKNQQANNNPQAKYYDNPVYYQNKH